MEENDESNHHHNGSISSITAPTGTLLASSSSRILRLSGGMHLDILISRLKAAAASSAGGSSRGGGSKIQEISCLNAQLEWIAEPLLELLHSQSCWMKLEFVHCHGIDSILSQLNNNSGSTTAKTRTTQIKILSCKGGCSDHIPTANAIAMGLQTGNIQKLELNDFFTCCESMKVITTGIANAAALASSSSSASASSSHLLEYLDVSNSIWPSTSTSTSTIESTTSRGNMKQQKQPLDYLIQALAKTSHLKGFACENCRLSDSSMANIVQAIRHHSNLHNLKLRGNSCQQLTLQALADIIPTTTSSTSNHKNICIHSTKTTFASSLEVLTITNHDALSEDPIPGLDDFFTALALQHYPKLQSLSIAEYMIPLEYMQTLVSALLLTTTFKNTNNNGITNLNFNACGLRTSTIRYFANKLPQMGSLHSLSLPDDGSTHGLLGCYSCSHHEYHHPNHHRNNGGNSNRCNNNIYCCDGGGCGLKGNTTLCHLSMSQVPLTMWHEYYLDMNRGGRRLLATPPLTTTTTLSNSSSDADGGSGIGIGSGSDSMPTTSTTPENDNNVVVEDTVLLDKLWPIVLERAEHHVSYYGGPKRCHDVVYLLLRNKILLEQR